MAKLQPTLEVTWVSKPPIIGCPLPIKDRFDFTRYQPFMNEALESMSKKIILFLGQPGNEKRLKDMLSIPCVGGYVNISRNDWPEIVDLWSEISDGISLPPVKFESFKSAPVGYRPGFWSNKAIEYDWTKVDKTFKKRQAFRQWEDVTTKDEKRSEPKSVWLRAVRRGNEVVGVHLECYYHLSNEVPPAAGIEVNVRGSRELWFGSSSQNGPRKDIRDKKVR